MQDTPKGFASSACQIVGLSLQDRSKERNGDSYGISTTGNTDLVAAIVADGVGSSACDWLASRTACHRFAALLSEAKDLASAPAQTMESALRQIDWELNSSTGRARGMKCAASAVLWAPDQAHVWFATVGDTRLYRLDNEGLCQVSDDESQAVVRRGSGGKPLISGGMVVVQRGITNALGTGNAQITIRTCDFPEGAALILCTDGFYDCATTFENDVLRVFAQQDLQEALAAVSADYEAQNRDDATIIILRRSHRPLTDTELGAIMASTSSPAMPLHVVTAAIAERLPRSITSGNADEVRVMLGWLTRFDLVLKRSIASDLLQLMADRHWADAVTSGTLQAMLRKTSRST